MIMESDMSSSGFTMDCGLSCVPQQYIIPTLHRSNLAPKEYANVAVIDVAALKNGSASRSRAIQQIRDACRHLGFFQVSFFLPFFGLYFI